MAIKLKSGNGPVLRAPQRSDTGGTLSHDYVTVQTSGGFFHILITAARA